MQDKTPKTVREPRRNKLADEVRWDRSRKGWYVYSCEKDEWTDRVGAECPAGFVWDEDGNPVEAPEEPTPRPVPAPAAKPTPAPTKEKDEKAAE